MITYYLSTDHGLEILAQPTAGCWINVVAPSAEEVAELHAMLRVPQDFITYPLDVGEMARTERESGATLMVLRVPYYQGQTADIPYTTVPIGIILTESYITTVCKTETDVIQALVAGRARGLMTGKPNRLTLQLLLLTASQFLAYLREINKSVDRLEDQLQRSLRNREVLELLKFQKSLTFFATGLTSNELMLQHLQKSRLFEPFAEEQDLLDDVLTEVQQAIGMTNISSNILSQMMDAFASIISNNLNVVMKFLASVTIILSLPTMIASFYGMNVKLPLGGHEMAFLFIGIASVTIMMATLLVFWRKDWL
jgi:magnesium transporter